MFPLPLPPSFVRPCRLSPSSLLLHPPCSIPHSSVPLSLFFCSPLCPSSWPLLCLSFLCPHSSGPSFPLLSSLLCPLSFFSPPPVPPPFSLFPPSPSVPSLLHSFFLSLSFPLSRSFVPPPLLFFLCPPFHPLALCSWSPGALIWGTDGAADAQVGELPGTMAESEAQGLPRGAGSLEEEEELS